MCNKIITVVPKLIIFFGILASGHHGFQAPYSKYSYEKNSKMNLHYSRDSLNHVGFINPMISSEFKRQENTEPRLDHDFLYQTYPAQDNPNESNFYKKSHHIKFDINNLIPTSSTEQSTTDYNSFQPNQNLQSSHNTKQNSESGINTFKNDAFSTNKNLMSRLNSPNAYIFYHQVHVPVVISNQNLEADIIIPQPAVLFPNPNIPYKTPLLPICLPATICNPYWNQNLYSNSMKVPQPYGEHVQPDQAISELDTSFNKRYNKTKKDTTSNKKKYIYHSSTNYEDWFAGNTGEHNNKEESKIDVTVFSRNPKSVDIQMSKNNEKEVDGFMKPNSISIATIIPDAQTFTLNTLNPKKGNAISTRSIEKTKKSNDMLQSVHNSTKMTISKNVLDKNESSNLQPLTKNVSTVATILKNKPLDDLKFETANVSTVPTRLKYKPRRCGNKTILIVTNNISTISTVATPEKNTQEKNDKFQYQNDNADSLITFSDIESEELNETTGFETKAHSKKNESTNSYIKLQEIPVHYNKSVDNKSINSHSSGNLSKISGDKPQGPHNKINTVISTESTVTTSISTDNTLTTSNSTDSIRSTTPKDATNRISSKLSSSKEDELDDEYTIEYDNNLDTTTEKISIDSIETIHYNEEQQNEETCQSSDGKSGKCILIHKCKSLFIKNGIATAEDTIRLQRAHCGFDGNIPKVCCQETTQYSPHSPKSSNKPQERMLDTSSVFLKPSDCGISGDAKPKGRIVGGIAVRPGTFPWIALLGYRRIIELPAWKCSGSLISTQHVLTAAHCIFHQEKFLYLVRLGELDIDSDDDGANPIDINIKKLIMHNGYDRTALVNDIGLIVMVKEVKFTAQISPICLPFTAELRSKTYERYTPIIAGWGDVGYRQESSTTLLAVQIPVVTNKHCDQVYNRSLHRRNIIDDRHICAGGKSGQDACKGDSGGPLMQPIWNTTLFTSFYYQLGIVSYGKRCGEPGIPGVYTRVTHFIPWIEQQMEKYSYSTFK